MANEQMTPRSCCKVGLH